MAVKLTKSLVDQTQPKTKDHFLWDTEVTGFALKVTPKGRKVYVCKYRLGSGRRAPTRRFTIGPHGSPWTVDTARKEARRILAKVAMGIDPAKVKQEAKKVLTVSELCDEYLEYGTALKKESTLATDRGRIERHIKPLIGQIRLPDLNKPAVIRFMKDIAEGKTAIDVKTRIRGRSIVTGGKGTASRTVGLLGGILSYAVDAGLISQNPVRGVQRYRDKANQRFLSIDELVRLGEALNEAEKAQVNPMAIAILRLLIFTGCRKSEIQNLLWSQVDLNLNFLRLSESKTGQSNRPLNTAARELLLELPRHENSDYVFPAQNGNTAYVGTPKVWRRIRERAGLLDVRIHDLRHSFASVAVSEGASFPVIGALLGHKNSKTTEQYAHLRDDPVRGASEHVGSQLSKAISK